MGVEKGLFISFEGGEGTGKSTQIRMLGDWLQGQGKDVVLTREPGGTPEAEKIRDLLVQRDGGNWSPVADTMLLYAARVMHVDNLIKPALENGHYVLSDRFADSTRAYQGYGLGMDLQQIETIHKATLHNFEPDLTIILDMPAETGLQRSTRHLSEVDQQSREATEDRYERMDISFHEKLRQGFLEIAKQNSERCHVINAMDDIETIHRNITDILSSKSMEGAA